MLSSPIRWKRSRKSKKDKHHKKNYHNPQDGYYVMVNPEPFTMQNPLTTSQTSTLVPFVHREPSQNVLISKSPKRNHTKSGVLVLPSYANSNHNAGHSLQPAMAYRVSSTHGPPPKSGEPVIVYTASASPSGVMLPSNGIHASSSPSGMTLPSPNDPSKKQPFNMDRLDPNDVAYYEQRVETVKVYPSRLNVDKNGFQHKAPMFSDDNKEAPAAELPRKYKKHKRQTSFIDETLKPKLHNAKEFVHDKKAETKEAIHDAKLEMMRTGSGILHKVQSVTDGYFTWSNAVTFLLYMIILVIMVWAVRWIWLYFAEPSEMLHGPRCYCRLCRRHFGGY